MDRDRVRFQAEVDQLVAEMGEELRTNWKQETIAQLYDAVAARADNEDDDTEYLEQFLSRLTLVGLYHILLCMPQEPRDEP